MPESLSLSPEEQEQEHQEKILPVEDLSEILKSQEEIQYQEQIPGLISKEQIERRNLLQILITKITDILRNR